jgi:integrase
MAIVERGEAFYVKVHRGRGRYEHVGTFRWDEHGGKRAARRVAERAEADAYERRRGQTSTETCDAFAARWPVDYPIVKHGPTRGQRKSDKTLRVYRDELKPFVREFAGVRLSDVDRRAARRYANERPRSAVVVRNMFSDALDDGLVDANPFANLQLEEARGRSEHPTISEDELHDLADCATIALGQGYGQVYRSFILATGYIGCRINEGVNLEHRDLRPREREVDLRITKFSKPRTVLLLPEAWDAIRAIPRQTKHDRVWYAKRGGPITKGNHQSLWTPVRALWWGKLSEARRCELVDFDWHSLRHFTAHFFYVVRGYGPELAAYQLGHTDPNLVIRRYGKPFQGALDRLKRASDGPKVVPLRPLGDNVQEGGRGA